MTRLFPALKLSLPYFALWLGVSVSGSALSAGLEVKTLNAMKQWRETYGLPSLSMAIAIDDDIVFSNAMGYADIERNRAATPDTLYSAGSMAKPMTGLALARLIDQGHLTLSDTVSQHLPGLVPAYSTMSLHQLASHTAGVGRPWAARNALEFGEPKDRSSPMQVLPLLLSNELDYEPGKGFQYSSVGYVLLSAVIEQSVEPSYIQTMAEQVWKPLGMTASALDDSSVDQILEAKYYESKTEDGRYLLSEPHRDRSYLFGGGGFVSTPSDLVRMSSAWIKKGYLSDKALQALQTPVLLESGEANEQNYALGWRVGSVDVQGNKTLALHHGGVTYKAATGFVYIIPEYRAAIAYMTNMAPGAFGAVREQAAAILVDYLVANN